MSNLTVEQTIGELVAQKPGRSKVFETFGLDYCCGGNKTVTQACQEKGIDPKTVLGVLKMLEDRSSDSSERDWSQASMAELCSNIEHTHHAYLKRDLPRLGMLVAKVANVHGANHPYLVQVRDTFIKLKKEFEEHMVKEERMMFPLCRMLETADKLPENYATELDDPIKELVHEHTATGEDLAIIRRLTDDYKLPPDACNSYRAMFEGLQELEHDTHRHVHKENSILFPRAAAKHWKLKTAGN